VEPPDNNSEPDSENDFYKYGFFASVVIFLTYIAKKLFSKSDSSGPSKPQKPTPETPTPPIPEKPTQPILEKPTQTLPENPTPTPEIPERPKPTPNKPPLQENEHQK
jgi:hypothetical protein